MNDTPAACHLSLISVASHDTLTADPAADAAVSVVEQDDRSSFSSFSSISGTQRTSCCCGAVTAAACHLSLISVASRDTLTADPAADAAALVTMMVTVTTAVVDDSKV